MGRTDAELIAACRAGDTAAFGEIVARYQRAVVAVAYAAVRDRVLAEDIAQDAFVLGWQKLAALRDVERLPAWLCGIARNVARARNRTRGREQPGETDVVGDTTPFTSLDDAQREAAVAAALARVPEAFREPLVLVYCEQQRPKDVARVLGTSDAAVHQRLSRGRALLASDAELVEHAGSRSRRDLAVAVLAAIVLGVGSSRVEASPRGLPMLKLTAIALTATLAAGTTYVVARGTSRHASQSTTTSPIAIAHAPALGIHPRTAANTTPAHALAHLPGTYMPLTCSEVAAHMTTLAFANAPDMPEGAELDNVEAPVRSHFESTCERGEWSQAYMGCVLGSPDSYSMALDCAAYQPPAVDEEPQATDFGVGVMIKSRSTPIAPTKDHSCTGIAQHMVELSAPDEAELGKLPADERTKLAATIAATRDTMRTQVEQGCVDTAWPEDRRTCIAAATTTPEMLACQ